jgi:Leucine Rich repeats (2 copies)
VRIELKCCKEILQDDFFSDILKIDHVWILPNLQVLSLAFNKIDKIENLEALTNLRELNLTYNSIEKLENLEGMKSLEIFSVFGNKIRVIEGVDSLDNLIIFSVGNNLIDTKKGVGDRPIEINPETKIFLLCQQVERLRFLKKLRSLNMKGNELEKNEDFFRIYIAGLLPQLTYYENKYISKEERNEGRDRFRFEWREIMDFEKVEVQERERTVKEKVENLHYTKCFVEDLDKQQLLDSLFVFDSEDQGECLLNIGGEEKNLIAEFRDQSYLTTQKIFKIGLEHFQKRSQEENVFTHCVTVGRKKVQALGQE